MNKIFENREGYRFFEQDPSGNIKEFYSRGLKDQKAYYSILLKIARRIADQMISRETPRTPPPPVPSKGKAIYLAAPADELRDAGKDWQTTWRARAMKCFPPRTGCRTLPGRPKQLFATLSR